MFDFVRKHTRLLQFILVLLIFPSFVFFGIQGYSRFSGGENTPVAKVDGHDITQAEWTQHNASRSSACAARCPASTPSSSTRRR
jgi:peptidyl-prolyl cis-trans isomerase D